MLTTTVRSSLPSSVAGGQAARPWTTSRPLTSTSDSALASLNDDKRSSAEPSINGADCTSTQQHELLPEQPYTLSDHPFNCPENPDDGQEILHGPGTGTLDTRPLNPAKPIF